MWLLEENVFHRMDAAAAAGSMPSAQEQAAYAAEVEARQRDGLRNLTVAGNTASISIRGVLTDSPDLFAEWFGGGNTVYSDIRQAAIAADADPTISLVDFDFDSPGGAATAEWMAVMDVIADMSTPTRATVRGTAASAAYGIASQADTIEAVNSMASVGSVGVVATLFKSKFRTEVTSSNAENKRPDPDTEEGRAVIRAHIDQIESEFISAIARGRKREEATVRESFGRGAMFLAAQATERGMIDGTMAVDAPSATPTAAATASDNDIGVPQMDRNQLQAEHPAVYAEVVQIGVTQERSRVATHLELGAASGAMDMATAAIADGSEVDSNMQGRYLAAQMRQNRVDASAADDAEVGAAADGADTGEGNQSGASFDEQVVAQLEHDMGIADNG